ncbi:hypothetical protein C8Q76DRAFT_799936 [Earliella scabrosa]|nr:hypothetical protein C8Q76DRAFT_799936 [Earliella scabrosa]
MCDPTSHPIDRLDDGLYVIDEQAAAFMKRTTGIQDEEELKGHILEVQAEAYAIYPYPCIRRFTFTQLTLARLPAYQRLLTLGKEREGAILLDVGCCFGNDLRKAIMDGYPKEGALAFDLRPEFWELGHKLFRSTTETFPVPFIRGDVFNPVHLEIMPPCSSAPDQPIPRLSSLTSLNPLRGHISVIHASAFFHLFSEEKQFHLAQALAGLLSPRPGSMIIGSHGGRPHKGLRTEVNLHNSHGATMFCHSPDSWVELWDGQVFEKGTVKVDVDLKEDDRKDLSHLGYSDIKFYVLVWSVTRL